MKDNFPNFHFCSVGHISLDMLSRNSTGSWICLVHAYFFDKAEAGYANKRYAYNVCSKFKVKLWWVGARERNKRAFFVLFIMCFISMYRVLNTLPEYTCFYIPRNLAPYFFWFVFKIVESLQCILKRMACKDHK